MFKNKVPTLKGLKNDKLDKWFLFVLFLNKFLGPYIKLIFELQLQACTAVQLIYLGTDIELI